MSSLLYKLVVNPIGLSVIAMAAVVLAGKAMTPRGMYKRAIRKRDRKIDELWAEIQKERKMRDLTAH